MKKQGQIFTYILSTWRKRAFINEWSDYIAISMYNINILKGEKVSEQKLLFFNKSKNLRNNFKKLL